MFTRVGGSMLGVAVSLLALGAIFASTVLLAAAALPLFLVAADAMRPRPSLTATREVGATRVPRGGIVDVTLRVSVPAGRGIVEVHQRVPAPFRLVEGSNYRVLALGKEPREETIAFRLEATARGRFDLAPPRVRHESALGLVAPHEEDLDVQAWAFDVLPAHPRVMKRTVGASRGSRIAVGTDLNRHGVEGTDFREIGAYAWGDSVRAINWKATARQIAENANPLVNRFEREGRRDAWLVLDASSALVVGTETENALEDAIDVTLAFARLLLERGVRVGLLVANSGGTPPTPPRGGRGQLECLRRVLATVRSEPDGGLVEAVRRSGAALRNGRLHVLVTRFTADSPDLLEGLPRLAALARAGHGRLAVVDVRVARPPATSPGEAAADRLAHTLDDAARMRARSLGVAVHAMDAGDGDSLRRRVAEVIPRVLDARARFKRSEPQAAPAPGPAPHAGVHTNASAGGVSR